MKFVVSPPLALVVTLALSPRFLCAGTNPQPGDLTIEALVGIRHPSKAAFAPDGQHVAFAWERAGAENVYVVRSLAGEPVALTHHDSGLVAGLFWSRDGRTVYFERQGHLWQVAASGSEPEQPVFTTPEGEAGFAPSHDGSRVAFSRKGDLFVRNLADGRETRLTETVEEEAVPVWSPDDRWLAFESFSSTPLEETPEYAGGKIGFRSQQGLAAHAAVVSATGGKVVPLARTDGTETSPRWLDASHLTLHRLSQDLRTREVVVVDAATGEGRVLFRETDPKFWSLVFLAAEPVPSPDGRLVAFVSDRDGFDQAYVVPAGGGEPRQITGGPIEVSRLSWSPDGSRLAFDANSQERPGSRQVMVAEVSAGVASARVLAVTSGRGTNTGAAFSPDGMKLLYQHTDPRNSADLFLAEVRNGTEPRRLTHSLPAQVDPTELVEGELVHYPSRDQKPVPAYLFVPKGLDRTRKHPAVVWVHGDGITQNFDGWHTRRDYAIYYSFHQYLLQRGYVVLAVDYRGSIGYGRDWRQGHYRDLGGRDYEDVAAGVDFLRGLGYVDTDRVGIWGLSYGGFMALQAVTVTPERFRCAIDVAGVPDWRDWYHDPDGPWIRARLGRPEDEPELYDRTSPIHRLDRIVRPLLVMHGTADVNVPFVESVRLVDALQKAGKSVDFVMYPGEFHYFQRAHVLRDAWERAERFFDVHLRR
jgi:dipeptidyl aminopeptidase/acylaminoacyl peptidase